MKIKDKNNNWIDDVVKQHKKQLDDLKKNRGLGEDPLNKYITKSKELLSSKIEPPISSFDMNEDEDLIKSHLENKNNVQIKENYYIENKKSGTTDNKNKLNLDYGNIKSRAKRDEFERYRSYQSTNQSKESSPVKNDELNILKSNLEIKNLRMREMKKQLDDICQENAGLKFRINQLETYKQSVGEKIDSYDKDNKIKDLRYMERQRELISTIKQMEQEKINSDEKLAKFISLDNIKSQELEIMHQKIKEFEYILDGNQNEHMESIKNLKLELENYKKTQYEYEKLFDILNYFFKKVQYCISGNKNTQNNTESQQTINRGIFDDPKLFQNKLIEIEDFIAKLINENNSLNEKYSKILKFQSKLTQSESIDNSEFHIETVKKLNEKIYDLGDENNRLKEEIKMINSKTEKENLNTEDEREKIITNNMKKSQIQNTPATKHEPEYCGTYKTLENRVLELEKEYKFKRVKSRNISSNKSQTKIVKRSRSTNQTNTPSTPSTNNYDKAKIIQKNNKQKIKIKSEKTLDDSNKKTFKKVNFNLNSNSLRTNKIKSK